MKCQAESVARPYGFGLQVEPEQAYALAQDRVGILPRLAFACERIDLVYPGVWDIVEGDDVLWQPRLVLFP